MFFTAARSASRLAIHFGFGAAFTIVWKILQWPIALFFLLITFDLIYYFGPNDRRAKRRFWTAGAATAVVLWLLVSFGFRIYLHFFNSYSVTYGSLGALIVLMLWFYFTGLAILIGGEINSELQQGASVIMRQETSQIVAGAACLWSGVLLCFLVLAVPATITAQKKAADQSQASRSQRRPGTAPTQAKPVDELTRLREEFIKATNEYKASLEKLRASYEKNVAQG